jgi:hypothetical protein
MSHAKRETLCRTSLFLSIRCYFARVNQGPAERPEQGRHPKERAIPKQPWVSLPDQHITVVHCHLAE